MDKIYNPKNIEQLLYKQWEQQGYFKPNNDIRKDSYCIILPPPNITGSLHMGHAFQQTIMDVLIRYKRMQGKNTLWQPGTDHAGIATQILVERKIAIEDGKTRHDYSRDSFIDKIWQWKLQYGNTITHQMRRLGYSVDWERERFTMDEGISNATREIFIRLYQENLIYRGKRLVNWDPKLRTAISDLEVEHRELKGLIWYLRYPLADGEHTSNGLNYLVIATTRPETILGDTGVAVNSKDSRYHDLIGKFIILPLVGRRIPIIGDEHVDMIKGTGCVKITPAHDFNDYEIGKRHKLPMINIFTFDGKIRQKVELFNANGKYIDMISSEIPIVFRGLERFVARKEIVAALDRLGLLAEVKTHNTMVPYGDRSGVAIEPMLTDQWYVRTAPLAKAAITAVKQGQIQFVSKKYENMYFSWMMGVQDWCISRQIWWGHRIPAWYDTNGRIYVGRSEAEVRQQNQLIDDILLRQDDDVLDTWFSSGSWTFSIFDWPKKTDALRTFYPTNVVVSGFDIIFFWIARMIMLSMHFIKDDNGNPQVPFNTIYITGLIRDEKGHKMSKSKGNVIDPLDLIDGISLANLIKKRTDNMLQPQLADKIRKRTEKQFPNGIEPHGTDALRFTLVALATSGRDINWDMKRLKGYRNFCNKLWNASRFVLINTEKQDCGFNGGELILSLADRWILAKFNQTVKIFHEALDMYRFDVAAGILYEFVWNQFCDWYIELTKITINCNNNANDNELRGARHTLISVLEGLLRLAHPIIPFITETIWQQIKSLIKKTDTTIMLQPFPIYDLDLDDNNALIDLEWIKNTVVAIRTIRAQMNIVPTKLLTVILRHASSEVVKRVKENFNFILTLAKLENIIILSINDRGPISITQPIEGAELLIPMAGTVDKIAELKRLEKEMICIERKIGRLSAKLSSESFINYAPKSIVDRERNKLKNYQQSRTRLYEQQAIIADL